MGRKIKPGLHLEFELDEGYAATGFAYEMTKQIDTNVYMNDVIHFAHAVMSKEFDEVAAVAAVGRVNLSHVYEPGHEGNPEFQLWDHRLYGRGKQQQASFEWLPSRLPILKPEARSHDPEDPMSKVDSDIIEHLSEEDYVFVMRAPMMEYGLRANILPTNAKFLFIPTFEGGRWYRNKKEGTSTFGAYRLEKHNIPDFNYRNPQDPSGEDGTVGNFTATWVAYWAGGGAEEVWNTQVVPLIEEGFSEAEYYMGRAVRKVKSGKNRRVSASISSFASQEAAMEAGRNLAIAFVKGQAASYRQAAKHIERHGYFGEGGY
jgi:hypothetical protein